MFYSLKKWLFCYWFHDRHKCFPEVWGRGLDGPWHCMKCHPCSEGLDELLDSFDEYEKENPAKETDTKSLFSRLRNKQK